VSDSDTTSFLLQTCSYVQALLITMGLFSMGKDPMHVEGFGQMMRGFGQC